MDAHDLGLLIDAAIEGSPDRDVIGMNAVVLEYLLDCDADRRAASPDRDQKCGSEAAAHDLHGELDRIAQQRFGGNEHLVDGLRGGWREIGRASCRERV